MLLNEKKWTELQSPFSCLKKYDDSSLFITLW
jgi:hypothetical protein